MQILALLQELEVFGSLLVVLTVQNADGLELGVDVEGIREVRKALGGGGAVRRVAELIVRTGKK